MRVRQLHLTGIVAVDIDADLRRLGAQTRGVAASEVKGAVRVIGRKEIGWQR